MLLLRIYGQHPILAQAPTALPAMLASPQAVRVFLSGGEVMTQPKSTTILAAEYAEMHSEKRDLESKLNAVKAKIAKAEGILLVKYADDEVTTIKTKAGTVYLSKRIWGSCTDPILLSTTEWEWMVKETVNVQTLSSTLGELPKDELGNPILPEDIMKECIEVTPVYKILVRQS